MNSSSAVQKMVLIPLSRYEQLLGSHKQVVTTSAVKGPSVVPTITQNHPLEISATHEQESPIDTELILAGIPKQYKTKARALLSYLKSSSIFNWHDNGEITLNGIIVKNSHIADLIKYAMRDYGQVQPEGLEQFRLAVAQLNIPKNLIGNPRIFDSATKLKPPGVPAHTARFTKWVNL